MSIATKQHEDCGEKEQQSYSFVLILGGVESVDEKTANALFEAGCDDALFGTTNGTAYLDFDRLADSAVAAIMSAVADVERVPGLRVVQVVPPGEQAIELVNAYLRLRNQAKDPKSIDLSVLQRLIGK